MYDGMIIYGSLVAIFGIAISIYAHYQEKRQKDKNKAN